MLLRHTQFNFKPDLPVQLNRNHPLATGIVGCWLFNEAGGSIAVDLAGDNDGVFSDVSDRGVDVSGRFSGPFGSSDRINLGSVTSADPLSLFGKTEITVIWEGVFRTGTTFQRIIDKSTAGNAADGWAVWSNGTNLQLQIDATSGAVDYSGFFSNGVRHTGAIIQDSLTAGRAYRDGKFFGSETPNYNVFPSSTADTAIGNWNHTTGRNWSGELSYVFVYARALSAKEVRDLDENPYQILQPVTRVLPTFVAAAPSGASLLLMQQSFRQ